MTEKELWKYISKKKIARTKPFDKDFVWISKENFANIKQFFVQEKNFFHQGKSYRSKAWIRHIHIVDQGDYFFAHKDTGNPTAFFPLALLHLIFDLIPFMIFLTIKGITKESVIKCSIKTKKDT